MQSSVSLHNNLPFLFISVGSATLTLNNWSMLNDEIAAFLIMLWHCLTVFLSWSLPSEPSRVTDWFGISFLSDMRHWATLTTLEDQTDILQANFVSTITSHTILWICYFDFTFFDGITFFKYNYANIYINKKNNNIAKIHSKYGQQISWIHKIYGFK